MDIKFKSEQVAAEIAEKPEPAKCQICEKSKASYQCRRCNISYFRLECYRNQEKHVDCSEDFYRDQVVAELKMCKLDDDDVEAKTQIARILKREASQRATGLNGEEQDIDNEENEIEEQELASVNTNAITDDELLKIYSSKVQKWKPWWQSFESKTHLLEEIGQNTDRKPLNLNLNYMLNYIYY
jgi:hypothetical protein